MASTATPQATKGPAIVLSVAIFTTIAFAALCLRLISRIGILKNPGWDDVSIILSMIFSIVMFVCQIEEVKYGLGRHTATISAAEMEKQLRWLYISIIFYVTSMLFSKLALILQYLRVFAGKRIRLVCWCAMFVLLAGILQTLFTNMFMCIPIHAFWRPDTKGARCINRNFIWFFHASINIFIDLFIFIIPVPVVKSLNLPQKQKFLLMGVFALGIFGCLTSIIRLHSLYTLSKSTDVSWDNASASIWSNIETNTVIVCAALPTVRPLLARVFPRLMSHTRSKHGYAGQQISASEHRPTAKSIPLSSIIRTHPSMPDMKLDEPMKRADAMEKALTVEEVPDEDVGAMKPGFMEGERRSDAGSEDLILARRSPESFLRT